MLSILIFIAFVTPYRVAFVEYDEGGWLIFQYVVNVIFTLDIFINFITAYFDQEDNLVLDRKKIALHYLKTWFFIDFLAVFPLSSILSSDVGSLSRLAKLPRLYRLIKIAK
jgi:hypothetical protein